MLNGSLEDWSYFIEADRARPHLDKDGNPATYEELLARADTDTAAQIESEKLAARYAAAMSNLEKIRRTIHDAALDTLIVVGDDQGELHGEGNMPCILIYRGETIANVPPPPNPNRPEWARRLSAKYFEETTPRDYPVDAKLAHHLIDTLMEHEFDIACANSLEPGQGEGHAFGFVHNRLLQGEAPPVVPVFMNTYFPPNQASPRRCYRLGQVVSAAVESYSEDIRVGIIASGGLSHFTVDEDLDGEVLRALREKDAETLCALPRNKLNGGSSEIRNWICAAGALEHLPLTWMDYQPGYRTPAGTGTGLGFAIWS
ncbi:MAG: extradiol ring-cleavage dioxygenase [Rhodospirillaceae bacterium]|nr:extradiol ring-cleavage dioxygenase [Rhodospirillaceae bacterium]MBT5192374.1 extradiol ring-cleavage dioxygenase [Rhodospirillaceae bacterium]MBT6428625.1 extradiol ring-cleavage dioxygenase [Rhodospirillaceae bacterium]